MPEAVIAGHPTTWRLLGDGPRPVLALHCSLAHGGAWGGVATLLPGVQVIAPDLPGHGRSADWDRTGDFATLATRVAIDLATPQAPVDVIGHSFGAVVALRLALERPELVRSLVLIEPVLFAAARAADPAAYAAHRVQHGDFEAALIAGDLPAAASAFHAIWGGDTPFAALSAVQRDYMTDRIALIGAQNAALHHDTGGLLGFYRLESLGVPVLLLQGSASPPVIDAVQTELARRLPMATRATVAGAGHMAPVTHPAAVAALIAAHLDAA